MTWTDTELVIGVRHQILIHRFTFEIDTSL